MRSDQVNHAIPVLGWIVVSNSLDDRQTGAGDGSGCGLAGFEGDQPVGVPVYHQRRDLE
jgi:hypothetical protein